MCSEGEVKVLNNLVKAGLCRQSTCWKKKKKKQSSNTAGAPEWPLLYQIQQVMEPTIHRRSADPGGCRARLKLGRPPFPRERRGPRVPPSPGLGAGHEHLPACLCAESGAESREPQGGRRLPHGGPGCGYPNANSADSCEVSAPATLTIHRLRRWTPARPRPRPGPHAERLHALEVVAWGSQVSAANGG